MSVPIPAELRRTAVQWSGRRGAAWVDGLPAEIDRYLERWSLRLDLLPGHIPWHGVCGLVLPVRTADDKPAALKLSPADEENRYEHTALAAWAGEGAVRLLDADPPRRALLLERLDGDRDLAGEPIDAATAELGRLLVRLAVPAPPEIGRLADQAEGWVEEWPRRWRELGITEPVRLLDQAVAAARELGPDSGDALVHADLHYENALAAGAATEPDRGYWLAIDPKPVAGDPAFGITPLLWNRLGDLGDSARDPALRRRLDIAVEAAGIDAERARRWSVAREVQNLIWYAEGAMTEDFARSAWVAGVLAQ